MSEVRNPTLHRSLPAPWDRVFPVLSRVFVWALLLSILYILRSFSLLLFLTFVFSYVQGHIIERLKPRIQNRILRVVFVCLVFLGLLIAVGSYIGPRFKEQAELFGSRFSIYLQAFDRELIHLSERYPMIDKLTPETKVLASSLDSHDRFVHWSTKESPSAALLQKVFGFGGTDNEELDLKETVEMVRGVGSRVLAASSSFLLSLLFAFLILLDLPALSRSVRGLADTKLSFIYHEVAGSIYSFAVVLGRALEAQLLIALLNTVLTGIGIHFLGLGHHIPFLAIIVFLCSFIPVAGVFFSSFPICLLALQESGVTTMFFAIGLILLIHFIETYFLNPRIFGHHLHVNPVLVLTILTIGGKIFGVWGLVLGLPVCTYFFGYAIRNHTSQANALASHE